MKDVYVTSAHRKAHCLVLPLKVIPESITKGANLTYKVYAMPAQN